MKNRIKLKKVISNHIKLSLKEDEVNNDITSKIINSRKKSLAKIIFKESNTFYGIDWANEVFKQIDSNLKIKWKIKDGKFIKKGTVICEIYGRTISILKSERTVLNYLQILSSTCSLAKKFSEKLRNKKILLLHTRKTIPSLRDGQNLACLEVGFKAHRLNLSESILIKENHLKVIGDLEYFLKQARKFKKPIIIEAKTIKDVRILSKYKFDRILLDNFKPNEIKKCLKIIKSIPIEISGNISINNINRYELPGISYISIGAVTKNICSIDMSLLIQ